MYYGSPQPYNIIKEGEKLRERSKEIPSVESDHYIDLYKECVV